MVDGAMLMLACMCRNDEGCAACALAVGLQTVPMMAFATAAVLLPNAATLLCVTTSSATIVALQAVSLIDQQHAD